MIASKQLIIEPVCPVDLHFIIRPFYVKRNWVCALTFSNLTHDIAWIVKKEWHLLESVTYLNVLRPTIAYKRNHNLNNILVPSALVLYLFIIYLFLWVWF